MYVCVRWNCGAKVTVIVITLHFGVCSDISMLSAQANICFEDCDRMNIVGIVEMVGTEIDGTDLCWLPTSLVALEKSN